MRFARNAIYCVGLLSWADLLAGRSLCRLMTIGMLTHGYFAGTVRPGS